MMKISTKGIYAVESLLYLAADSTGKPVQLQTVSEGIKVPSNYLAQLFFTLRKAGILDTVRGPYGGYTIHHSPETLKIGDIIRAVEGEIKPVVCVSNLSHCTSSIKSSCATRSLWLSIADSFTEVVDRMTLAELKEFYLNVKEEQ